MKLNKTERVLLVTYAGILLIAGAVWLLRSAFGDALEEVTQRIAFLESARNKIALIVRNRENIETAYRAVFPTERPAIAAGTLTTDLLQDVRQKATAAGLSVINIKPFEREPSADSTELRVRMEVEGSLAALGTFLFSLDDSPFNVSVRFTQIMAQGAGEPLRMQLLLNSLIWTS